MTGGDQPHGLGVHFLHMSSSPLLIGTLECKLIEHQRFSLEMRLFLNSCILLSRFLQFFRVVRAPASQLIFARTAKEKLSTEPELKGTDGEADINIILNELHDVSTSGKPFITEH